MSNKFHNRDTAPSKQSGGEGGPTKAMGSGGPKGEGHTGPNRSGGDPKTGKRGPFHLKARGI